MKTQEESRSALATLLWDPVVQVLEVVFGECPKEKNWTASETAEKRPCPRFPREENTMCSDLKAIQDSLPMSIFHLQIM